MNNVFKNGCNLVKYQTYNNIKNGLLVSGIVSGISNTLLSFSGITDTNFGYISSLFYFSYAFLQISKGQNYTKDVNELRTLYNEFIKNYNKMNRDFLFDEPVSIYTMFNFLFKNGYLSKDKMFEKNDDCYDFDSLMGLDVINGSGVCRHLAAMLSDILNNYGIPSINTVCYLPSVNYLVLPTSRERYSKEYNYDFIKKHVKSPLHREQLIQNLNFLEENGLYLTFEVAPLDKKDKKLEKTGNHLITYSLYNDKSYYMDPTLFNVYRLKDFKNGIIVDDVDKEIFIKKERFYIQNDLTDKEIKEFIGYMEKYQDSISLNEENDIVLSTLRVCEGNMDIFEKFYNDNYELYGEIINKLVKIKKRKK